MYQQITDDEKGEIASVLSHFDIGETLDIIKNTKANVNSIYLIETPVGKFILRKSNPKTTKQQLLFEAEILTFLEKKGFRFSPKIILTKTKEKHSLKDGAYHRLFSFLEGKNHLDWNSRDFHPQEYIAQFQFMARLHEQLHNFKPTIITDYPDVLTFLRTFSEELEYYTQIAQEKKCAFSKILLENITHIKKATEDCVKGIETLSYHELPKQIIHGDIHFGNLLFQNYAIAGIVDFDWCGFETIYWDFAYCFSQNGTFWSNGNDDGKLDFPLFFIALQSYFGERTVSENELVLLQQLVKVGDLRAVKWEINSYYDLGQEEKYIDFLQHTLRTLKMNEYHLLGKQK